MGGSESAGIGGPSYVERSSMRRFTPSQRALAEEIRDASYGVLCVLEHRKLMDSTRIRFEERHFCDIVAQCSVRSRTIRPGRLESQVVLAFQWPLWELLLPKERMEIIAHESCHAVADHVWTLRGERIESHGIEWRSLMKAVGYPDAEPTGSVFNPIAQRFLNARICEGEAKNMLAGRK